ncbi:MAG TPA: hypothetical protein VMM76_03265 [Pirellulaceae bacterium]|nr:hypothetical protein [Pirellulaceae bacterium]
MSLSDPQQLEVTRRKLDLLESRIETLQSENEELNELIKEGPVLIKMNNGDTFEIPSPEFAVVSDLRVHLLVRSESDGKLRAKILSLVCICSAKLLVS